MGTGGSLRRWESYTDGRGGRVLYIDFLEYCFFSFGFDFGCGIMYIYMWGLGKDLNINIFVYCY